MLTGTRTWSVQRSVTKAQLCSVPLAIEVGDGFGPLLVDFGLEVVRMGACLVEETLDAHIPANFLGGLGKLA